MIETHPVPVVEEAERLLGEIDTLREEYAAKLDGFSVFDKRLASVPSPLIRRLRNLFVEVRVLLEVSTDELAMIRHFAVDASISRFIVNSNLETPAVLRSLIGGIEDAYEAIAAAVNPPVVKEQS